MSHDTVFERERPAPAAIDASLAGTRQSTFWLDGLNGPSFSSLQGQTTADLTVVGGGYCGLWTAVLAKRRNPAARVVLLEAQTIGWTASGRNGGFVEASITHGEENGRNRWSDEFDTLERLGMENLDAFEAEIASPIFCAGRWTTDDCALVNPARPAKELARVAADLGVEIYEDSAVIDIDSRRSGPVRVRTIQGWVVSDQVALATNVFRSVLRRNQMMTIPVYDYVLMTDPLNREQKASIGWDRRQGLTDLANQFHYARLTADDRTLASHFLMTFPQIEDVQFTHQWVSPDQDALLAMLDELGLQTYERYRDGASVYVGADGGRHAFLGDQFPVAPAVEQEMQQITQVIDQLAATMDPARPWAMPNADALDRQTFDAWLAENCTEQEARDNLALFIAQAMLTKPAHTFSMLQAVHMAASAGGFSNLVDSEFILDQRVIGGLQRVPLALAERLGDAVLTGREVDRVQWGPDGVEVTSGECVVRALHLVLAVPPPAVSRIRFDPARTSATGSDPSRSVAPMWPGSASSTSTAPCASERRW